METQQYRITRLNPGINFSIPCSGGTDYWPINTSWNCSGLTMYQSTGIQIMNAIDFDINNFPEELRDCSSSNPCVILWDLNPTSHPSHCNNIGGYNYVKFTGLKLTSGATTYNKTYNELVPAVYALNNLTTSISLQLQTNMGAWFEPIIAPCGCDNSYLGADLYKLTTLLTQDINDIGHYSIWDGNMAQKEVFANFVYSGASSGWGIKLFNTTDFGYYPSLQDSEYEINWGDGIIETLQYPTLANEHIYCPIPTCPPRQYTITITHQTPWGPASSAKVITIPYKDYIGLLMEPYVASNSWTGGTGLGSQQFTYTYTPPNTTAQTISTAYHAMYPSSPLDSGTDINQYSGMGFDTVLNTAPCFTVSGVTDSMLGSFKQYTGATNSNFLPPGYRLFDEISIAGDVLDPITDNYVPGILGKINSASAQYTAYTLYSSVNQRTPIDFYDFPDGITIFIAESCGLDALAFGGGECYECPTDTCEWCLTKDEYIDRTSGNPNSGLPLVTPAVKTTQGLWNNYQNYVEGDIVFDKTFNDCCCYMALVDITQTGGVLSDFAGIAPALAAYPNPGVLINNSGVQVHVWEACSPDCASCPTGSMTPCDDPSIYSTSYDDSTGYTQNQYVSTLNGCYQATAIVGSTHPTADTTNTEWDYIGCVHWRCPNNPASPGGCVREPGVGGANTYMMWQLCDNDLQTGDCYPDRWLCQSQFDCGACTQIPATHPDWGNISATGPAFQYEADCLTYCKPPIFVCDDRTSSPCCVQVTCNNQPGGYTISNLGVWPAEKGPGPYDYDELTTNGTLGVDFHLTLAACQGTNNAGCCNLTKYNWSCEEGCYPVAGTGTFNDLTTCQAANHGNFQDAVGNPLAYSYLSNANNANYNICGWQCQISNQPCQPCFTDNCSIYGGNSNTVCNQNCSALTECYVCDCADYNGPCSLQVPCPTAAAGWDGVPAGIMGPDPTNANGGGHSFSSSTECNEYCTCDAGWDCWIDIALTQQNGVITSDAGCQFFANSADVIYNGLQATAGGPYDSFSACCAGTACCLVRCDDDWPTWTDALPMGYGDWPCLYVEPLSSGAVDAQGNPILAGQCSSVYDPYIPFCNMTQCHAAVISIPVGTGNNFCTDHISFDGYYDINGAIVAGSGADDDWCWECPGTGTTASDTCDCACGPSGANLYPGATHVDLGPYITSNPVYTMGNTVSYMDASNPYCCYICGCMSADSMNPMQFDGNIPRQCGVHSPADGPTFNAPDGSASGIINCWQSCGLMPSGTTDSSLIPTGCTSCAAGPLGTSYKCGGVFIADNALPDLTGGFRDGCIEDTSLTPCIPPTDPNTVTEIALQTAANCFSDEDCYMKCQAGCFCEAGGNPYTAGTSSCVTAQQYDANIANNPNAYGTLGVSILSFGIIDLNQCHIYMNAGILDCCGNPRYNCLSGHTCTSDSTIQAQQLSEMYASPLDACVPLYPHDPGYGSAQFTDAIATATSITLCDGSSATFLPDAGRTAAYNMCSYYCRWSCSPYLTPVDFCQFVGSDPAELAQTYHGIYNQLHISNGGCVTSPTYTSAIACWQSSTNPFDCFCNTDWVDCVTDSTTQIQPGGASLGGVINTTTCTCTQGATGAYHTMDECLNPGTYTNVPTSCCDTSTPTAWCLAVGGDLTAGGCDGGWPVLADATLLDIEQTTTDYATNESGMPGKSLLKQYYDGANYYPFVGGNANTGVNLAPNLMYALQAQINVKHTEPTRKLSDLFQEDQIVQVWGWECIEPNMPVTIMTPVPMNLNDGGDLYAWNIGDPIGDCCGGTTLGPNSLNYIKTRVRTYSHEYIIHANNYLTSSAGQVPVDSQYGGFDYSNLDELIRAADLIGVTGLTRPNTQVGWNSCPTCFSGGTNDYILTDIHEISYQITKQYFERIFPSENGGTPPPYCVEGEQYLPFITVDSTATTYMACVTLKTKNCCLQPCFCTEDGQAWTWGQPYQQIEDPTLSTGNLAYATNAPFVMDFGTWGVQELMSINFAMSNPTDAYGEGYYNQAECKSDVNSCCGQNTNGLVYGCTDQYAFNYDCKATTYPTGAPCGDGVNTDDGSCVYYYGSGIGYCIWGCMDNTATNYEPVATCFSACTY